MYACVHLQLRVANLVSLAMSNITLLCRSNVGVGISTNRARTVCNQGHSLSRSAGTWEKTAWEEIFIFYFELRKSSPSPSNFMCNP